MSEDTAPIIQELISKHCQKPSTTFYLAFQCLTLLELMLFKWQHSASEKTELKDGFPLLLFHFPSPFLHSTFPPTHPSNLSNSAREARAQIWRSNICQVNLGCFKVLQNCILSIPRNSTWLLTEAVCCVQDHRTFSSFSLLTSGCQSVVKNKIITNPPCCK